MSMFEPTTTLPVFPGPGRGRPLHRLPRWPPPAGSATNPPPVAEEFAPITSAIKDLSHLTFSSAIGLDTLTSGLPNRSLAAVHDGLALRSRSGRLPSSSPQAAVPEKALVAVVALSRTMAGGLLRSRRRPRRGRVRGPYGVPCP